MLVWEEAAALFAGQHPNWPLPLAEREAARTVGALILNGRMGQERGPKPSPNRMPLDLLVDLATPETPESMRAADRAESLGARAGAIFRGAWRIAPDPVAPGRLALYRRARHTTDDPSSSLPSHLQAADGGPRTTRTARA